MHLRQNGERMSETLVKLTGKPVYILYRNEETYYTVMRFRLTDDSERVITVTGLFPVLEADTVYSIIGNYVEHPRYGMQFQIESYERPLPNEAEGIVRYLSGAQFPGIGRKTAEKVVEALGEDCLNLIREDRTVLSRVPGLSPDKIEVIIEGIMQDSDGLEELVRFLNIHGIGMRNLIRLNRTYGKEALSKIKENPYRVIDECDGFGFVTADKIAMSLGFEESDERRLYAYLVSLCMDLCMRTGDSYVTSSVLHMQFEKQMQGIPYDFDSLLEKALLNRRLVMEEDRVYPVTQYDSEAGIASFLTIFPYEQLGPYSEELLAQYLQEMQESVNITYDEDQISAIESFFREPFMIMTGGPGTGKTTVVRAMVKLFHMLYPSSTVICAAPTGRAAKRLAELTGNEAMTIHSLLKWDLESNTFGVNADEPILADLLIIDEFSMVDNWLFYNVLLASKKIRKICIIGDEDQLPSVSPGSVLRDLIAADCFPLIRLRHIYRQKEGSDVINLAHDIAAGHVDFNAYKHDLVFIECQRYDIRANVLKIVKNALDKGYSMNDIQVLSPMYNGPAGIDVLNNALQEAFNPPSRDKKQIKSGYITFREGDKILQLKNQPDDDVFNGDIGILEEIVEAEFSENQKTLLIVNFDGVYVEYQPENFQNITLAYCISVHKSQGSEYGIVIFPLSSQHQIMLQRKLIYTGVTRARQSLVLLGEKNAFEKGISTLERHPRATTLTMRLQQYHTI